MKTSHTFATNTIGVALLCVALASVAAVPAAATAQVSDSGCCDVQFSPDTTSYFSPDTTSYYSPDTTSYYSPDTTSYYSPDTTTYYSPDTTSYYSPDTTTYYSPDTTTYYSPDTTAYYSPDTVTYYSPDTTSYSYVDTSYTTPHYDYSAPIGSTYNFGVGHQNYGVTSAYLMNTPHYVTPTYVTPTYTAPTYTAPVQPVIYNVNNNNNNVVSQPVPQYTYTAPVQPAPTCSISLVNDGGYAQYGSHPMRLTWSISGGMISAYISNLGSVQGYSGSQMVYPTNGQVYTMTVTGNGGTASCQTNVYYAPIAPMPTYPIVTQAPIYHPAVYPVQAASAQVALTQIPYTGFDFGVVGNSIYWFALALFAISAAYLIVYFRGGAFSLLAVFGGSRSVGNRKMPVITHTEQAASAPLKAHMPPVALKRDFDAHAATHDTHHVVAAQHDMHSAHTEHAMHSLPVAATHGASHVLTTTDTMTVIHAKNNEAPRIVISRA